MIAGQSAQSAYDAMEPDDVPYTWEDIHEALEHFKWETGAEYMAYATGFDGEDMTIVIEHFDRNAVNTGVVGTAYGMDDLGEWLAAFHAFEAVTPKDENGNTPRFAPAMSNGVVL